MSDHGIPQQQCTTCPILSEADFHKGLLYFFRPFVSIRPVDWTCIQKSMTFFAPLFRFKEFVHLYFDYIYGLFEDFRITDRAVIVTCLTKYCRFKLRNCGFTQFGDEFPYRVNVPQEYLNEHGVVYYEYLIHSRSVEELLSRPFMYQDFAAVTRILRYMAPALLLTEDIPHYRQHVVRTIRHDLLYHAVDWRLNLNQKDGRLNGTRRLKLILMVMEFLLQARIHNFKDCLEGLKFFFQTIPDPYVTELEILGFLKRRLPISPTENQISYIKSFQESCTEFFPECSGEFKPRSLKHLARCKVRRCLSVACTLPHGVWGLRLPSELEDYVLLQSRKDQFRPVIRPLSSERVFDVNQVLEIQTLADSNSCPLISYSYDGTTFLKMYPFTNPPTTCNIYNIIDSRGSDPPSHFAHALQRIDSYSTYHLDHMRLHKGNEHVNCDVCTKNRPYVCDVCEKRFYEKHQLKRHSRIHSGERPHHCDLCGRGFSRKDGLTRHIRRIHAGS